MTPRGQYVRRIRPLPERFWEKVDKAGPMPSEQALAIHPEIAGLCCWTFSSKARRYPLLSFEGKSVGAHCVAWFLATGAWPAPQCCHKCDVPNCCRYEHLFEGTNSDNVRDMIAKRRDRVVGERHPMAKLTAERVARIRRDGAPCVRHPRRKGTVLLRKRLAEREGVSTKTIDKILSGEKWK